MSVYSGRCDIYDTLVEIHQYTDEELKNNVKIYVGNSQEPLHIENRKDLIPYYPYLISSAYFDNVERKSTIYLTSKSSIDIEEQDILETHLKHLLRIYNRCKRKKIEFDIDEAVKEVTFNGWNEEVYRKLAIRVKEKGKKATIDGIHLKMHERHREELVEEMIRNGLDPCNYGYQRFL